MTNASRIRCEDFCIRPEPGAGYAGIINVRQSANDTTQLPLSRN